MGETDGLADWLGVGLGDPLGREPPGEEDGLAHGGNVGHGVGVTDGNPSGTSAVADTGPGDGLGAV